MSKEMLGVPVTINLASFPDAFAPKPLPEGSLITPEMIERNPVLAVAGYFAGDPNWLEVRKEIERYREQQRQEDALLSDAELLARHG